MRRTLTFVLVLALLLFLAFVIAGALTAHAETPSVPDVSAWVHDRSEFQEFEYRKNGVVMRYRFLAIEHYASDAYEGVVWKFLYDGSEIGRSWWPKGDPALRQFTLKKGDQWLWGAPGRDPIVSVMFLSEWKSGDDIKAVVWITLRLIAPTNDPSVIKTEIAKVMRIIPLP